jgi:hypothetical protein
MTFVEGQRIEPEDWIYVPEGSMIRDNSGLYFILIKVHKSDSHLYFETLKDGQIWFYVFDKTITNLTKFIFVQ